jgi:lipopolysaccharide transport system permease protein
VSATATLDSPVIMAAEIPRDHPVERSLTVIEPRRGFRVADLHELWRYRELFYGLTLRELKLRYKQTILGVGWSLFQPLATVLVFVVFIGYMGRTAEGIAHYPLYVLLGVLPWTYFAQSVQNAGNSLVANERLVTKVYFPRLLLPLSNIGSATVDFLVALGLAGMLMLWYGVAPGLSIIALPFMIALIFIAATGFGLLFSALIVAQRDFRYLLNFGMQLWMFATPCIYLPVETVGPTAKNLLPINPMFGLVLNFRNIVLGESMGSYEWYALGVSATIAVLILGLGLVYFRRVERTFADTI